MAQCPVQCIYDQINEKAFNIAVETLYNLQPVASQGYSRIACARTNPHAMVLM